MSAAASPYMTAREAAKKWKVHGSRVRQWLAEKRIPGAMLVGSQWLIPTSAKRPKRKKRGVAA